jgi:hypothetical protein
MDFGKKEAGECRRENYTEKCRTPPEKIDKCKILKVMVAMAFHYALCSVPLTPC